MDSESKKFGRGSLFRMRYLNDWSLMKMTFRWLYLLTVVPWDALAPLPPPFLKLFPWPRELTGAVDLINYYKLWAHHDFFCKRSLPLSIQETHYLHNIVGDTEIRKGDGMELNQLLQNTSYERETNAHIHPFDLETLRQAFQLSETAPVELPSAEKGIPTIAGKSKGESKDKEKKHKKHKDRDKEKDKEHKKNKHRHKDRSKDKDKEKKDKNGHKDSGGDHSKKHHDKKRKQEGNDDIVDMHKHKKSKHKSSKPEEMGAIRVAG